MTNWIPRIEDGPGPIYRRLADALEGAMADGTLKPEAKLPPQRDLAYDLKVTIGTIGRAYAMLRERGLVAGEVGRGTYVLDRARDAPSPGRAQDPFAASFQGTRAVDAPPDLLRFDTTAASDVGQGAIIGSLFAQIAAEHPLQIASYSRDHTTNWMEAGVAWLSRNGWRPEAQDVLPTLGAHAAALAVAAAVTAPGDRIAFETLTYSHISRSTRLIGRRTVTVETDAGGMVPEDFERVCAQQHPKLAFLMPTAHNPTLAVLSEQRRRSIVEIARRHGVLLIEDDVYGALSDDGTPLMASMAPERTFVVGGLSKAVAGGLRGGWVACPQHFAARVKITHKMMTGGLSFILAEAGARLVLSGAAFELRARTLAEIKARVAMAQEAFAGHDVSAHAQTPFLWLKLPEPWLSGTFKNAALKDGILIDDEDEFKAERLDRSFHRVRIAFSTPDRAAVPGGFARLRRLLDSGAAGYDGEV